MADCILELDSVSKHYGGVHALSGVSLSVNKGEIHSIIGENGAGKSTMMKIISGVTPPSSGNILFDGENVKFKNAGEAEKKGIFIIHQEPIFYKDMSVLENIFLGKESLNKLGLIQWKEMIRKISPTIENIGLHTNILNTPMKNLPIGIQQLVLIVKGIFFHSKLIILDEPTSILSHEESFKLFKILNEIVKSGTSILYISHRIPEILELSDYISIMKDGILIQTYARSEADPDNLLQKMSGRKIVDTTHAPVEKDHRTYDDILSVQDFSSGQAFKDISFSIKKGQILGFYGLVGAGRTEIAQAIIGERTHTGSILYQGQHFKGNNAKDSYRQGIVYLPEDRITQGIFLSEKIRNNMMAGLLNKLCKNILTFNKVKEVEIVESYVDQYSIKLGNINHKISSLSGGNQQKILLTRCIMHKPKVLILDEPTRGIDVNTKVEIYKIIASLALGGTAIMLISSELPEILALTNTVYVMHQGRGQKLLTGEECSEENILRYALGD